MPKISRDKKKDVEALLLSNKLSLREISKRTGISKSRVGVFAKELKVRRNDFGGRKPILSTTDVTFAVTQMTSKKVDSAENLTSVLIEMKGRSLSSKTVRRALHNAGLKATTKKKKPTISQKNRKERLAFAKSHKDWTVEDWKRVIFSDETKINRFGSDGRNWTWRRDGESLQPKDVKQTMKNGGGSIMLWGCITASGVGYICEIQGIMDQHLYKEILQGELSDTIEFYNMDEADLIFMQDNDPKHKAKSILSYLRDQEYEVMNWPAQSPDLNPIENCWSHLKSKIYSYKLGAKSMHELWRRVETEWEAISKDYIDKLYESMPRRMAECIRANGYWTKY